MDIATLAQDVVSSLLPCLPLLLKAGEGAAEEMGHKVGHAAWDKAKALWARLWPRAEAKPALVEALKDAADADPDAAAGLRFQVSKLLKEDPGLAKEIASIVEKHRVDIGVTGDRNVIIGGPAQNNVIVTGDHNKTTK